MNINNHSENINQTEEEVSNTGEKPVTIAIFVCLWIICCLCNGFVLYVFSSSEKLRKSIVNIYLINQSAIDLMASLMLIVTAKGVTKSAHWIEDRIQDQLLCRLMSGKMPLWSFLFSSSYNLIALNIERYISIIAPIYHKTKVNHRQVYISLMFVWLVGPVEKFCLHWFPSGVIDGTCYFFKIFPSPEIGVFAAVTNYFFQFMFPLLVLMFVYSHIALILWGKSRKDILREQNISPSNNNMSKAAKNVIKTMSTISIVFILCWTPNAIYFILYLARSDILLSGPIHAFTVYCVFGNAIINPFIYSVQYAPFQNRIKQLFCRNKSEGESLATVSSPTHSYAPK